MFSAYTLNKQGDNAALTYSFPYLEPVCCSMSSSNYCFLTCIQISQEAGQVVWCSHHFQNFPQFIVIHTGKGFGIVNKSNWLYYLQSKMVKIYTVSENKTRSWLWLSLWTHLNGSVRFSFSVVSDSATPWIAERQASLSITNSRSSLKLTSIELVMPSSRLIFCHPLLLLPPIPTSIRIFSSESTLCMRWPKYWSFSFSIIPSKEHPGLISFIMDWLDLLAVHGTVKSLLQHHSSKASILRCSAFFTVQLSHPYMTTGKTIALTRWTFVGNLSQLTHFWTFCIFTIIE